MRQAVKGIGRANPGALRKTLNLRTFGNIRKTFMNIDFNAVTTNLVTVGTQLGLKILGASSSGSSEK